MRMAIRKQCNIVAFNVAQSSGEIRNRDYREEKICTDFFMTGVAMSLVAGVIIGWELWG